MYNIYRDLFTYICFSSPQGLLIFTLTPQLVQKDDNISLKCCSWQFFVHLGNFNLATFIICLCNASSKWVIKHRNTLFLLLVCRRQSEMPCTKPSGTSWSWNWMTTRLCLGKPSDYWRRSERSAHTDMEKCSCYLFTALYHNPQKKILKILP